MIPNLTIIYDFLSTLALSSLKNKQLPRDKRRESLEAIAAAAAAATAAAAAAATGATETTYTCLDAFYVEAQGAE